MSAAVWRLEWRLALRRRRLLLLNVVIPLLLVLPIALGGAPAFHAAAAYAVLFVLFGTFGSAIPLLRDGDDGLLRRILLAGSSPRALLVERTLAGSGLDALQLVPSMVLVLAVGGAPAGLWILAPLLLAGALLAANLVGAWVAAIARSLAEGALFAAVVSLFLLHGSGVFRTPAPGSSGELVEALLPYGPLHGALLAAAAGQPWSEGSGAALLTTWSGALLLLLLTTLAAPWLADRIAPGAR